MVWREALRDVFDVRLAAAEHLRQGFQQGEPLDGHEVGVVYLPQRLHDRPCLIVIGHGFGVVFQTLQDYGRPANANEGQVDSARSHVGGGSELRELWGRVQLQVCPLDGSEEGGVDVLDESTLAGRTGHEARLGDDREGVLALEGLARGRALPHVCVSIMPRLEAVDSEAGGVFEVLHADRAREAGTLGAPGLVLCRRLGGGSACRERGPIYGLFLFSVAEEGPLEPLERYRWNPEKLPVA